jgi:hypothetical protein
MEDIDIIILNQRARVSPSVRTTQCRLALEIPATESALPEAFAASILEFMLRRLVDLHLLRGPTAARHVPKDSKLPIEPFVCLNVWIVSLRNVGYISSSR